MAVGCPLGIIRPSAQGRLWRKDRGYDGVPASAACARWGLRIGVTRSHRVCISLQLYTLSQDGALCVWQCDTPPEGLRLKPPRGWKADLLRREEEEEGGEAAEDGARETTIQGRAAPAAEEQQGKVKYSRLAK